MGDKNIKVLLVDDHEMVRSGIRLMLSSESDIVIAAEASAAQEALGLIRSQDFDVALVDIAMPGKSGLELLKQIRTEKPKLAVLILSIYSEQVYAVRALKAGASGYLAKESPASVLVTAVRKAAAGGKYVNPNLLDKLAGVIGGDGMASHDALSDRELEVLKLIAAGESLVKVAEKLHLSPNTVTTYRTRILEKMGMANNAELTRYAMENGLLV
jgi:DNA-binding NarL/FixJ family response regulator